MKIIYDWPDGNDPRIDVWPAAFSGRMRPEEVVWQIDIQAKILAQLTELLEKEQSHLVYMRSALKEAVAHEKRMGARIEEELAEYEKSNP